MDLADPLLIVRQRLEELINRLFRNMVASNRGRPLEDARGILFHEWVDAGRYLACLVLPTARSGLDLVG